MRQGWGKPQTVAGVCLRYMCCVCVTWGGRSVNMQDPEVILPENTIPNLGFTCGRPTFQHLLSII